MKFLESVIKSNSILREREVRLAWKVVMGYIDLSGEPVGSWLGGFEAGRK